LLCPIVGVVDAGKPCFVQLTCLRDQIGGGSSGSRGGADRPLSSAQIKNKNYEAY
jgi:hypothetical protein